MRNSGIGAFVREKRESLGLTQTALAGKTGISRARMSQIEGGAVALPGADHRRRLATALNVRHIELLVAAGELTEDEISDVAPLVSNDPDIDIIAESWEFLNRSQRDVVLNIVRALAEAATAFPVHFDPLATSEKEAG